MQENPEKDYKEPFINDNDSNDSLSKFNINKSICAKTLQPSSCQACLQALFPCAKKVNTITQRNVFFNDSYYNYTSFKNEVSNHKYNLITFIPLVLFNQFKFFGNQFFLLLSISQFVDVLKVGFLFTYIAPLLIVLATTMLKEAYDDIIRHITDRKTNNEEYILHSPPSKGNRKSWGSTSVIKSKDIKIGNIIEIRKNQRIPADMILVNVISQSGSNHVFIRTDQLDGETDWKLRKAPSLLQHKGIEEIMELNGMIDYQPPSKMIYEFEGVLNYTSNNQFKKEALGLENTLWASTILASEQAIGVVIYSGKETRVQMNSSVPKMKVGELDLEINYFNKLLFGIMVILAIVITVLKQNSILQSFIIFFRFIVLFCAIIPISLRVNLDISKTFFAYKIDRDDTIPGAIARNSTIPEELGRITYVFTDKTGTLTQNEMIFKKIAMENEIFSEDSFDNLSSILQDECKVADSPMIDLINILDSINTDKSKKPSSDTLLPLVRDRAQSRKIRRSQSKVIRDTITAMVLCNNVTPICDSSNPNDITYQASSPDEVALVKFAEKLNMKLIYRSDTEIHIKNANGVTEEYSIIANFPFSSDTKRMGIVLKHKKYNTIMFYLKGAENVIERFVKEEYVSYIKENAENLAMIGLRTLVLTQKIIPNDFFEGWLQKYNEALTSMENRKERINEVISLLENQMNFLCVTGVEDLLQDDVHLTIENLRNAGMKVWMLTGDKIETATCISISAGLKSKSQKIFFIKTSMYITESINSLGKKEQEVQLHLLRQLLENYDALERNSHILIIDGDSLDYCLHSFEEQFFLTAMKAPSVVCCRCSPTQKRIIVKTIKKYTDKRTCAIGDGGNDVAMIQEADVGIGIVGKEGLQASLSSDFSILRFNYLNSLLLWWGRISYKNTATMTNFVIHRGLIIALIQFIFSMMFYYNSVALYNGILCLGYSTIYTNFPAMAICLDKDTDKKNVMKFPSFYKALLQGREMSTKQFLWLFFKSLFQAMIIMVGSIYLFQEKIYLKIVTVTFSELIFAEVLNVYLEMHTFTPFMITTLVGTAIVYVMTLFFLPSILDVYYIFDWMTMGKIVLIAVVSWLPFFLITKIRHCLYPESYEKLNAIQKIEAVSR